MSRVLKTYDDGSEMTTKDLAVTYGVAIVAASVVVGAVISLKEWKIRRNEKKYDKFLDEKLQAQKEAKTS